MHPETARTRRADRLRRDIFEAAKFVFVTQGYAGATMDEVARAAGVTKVTVYAHAGSKAELFRAVVAEAIALSAEKLEPPREDLPPAEALSAYLARFVEISCWAGSVGLQRVVIGNLAEFPELGADIVEKVVGPAETLLGRYLDSRGWKHSGEQAKRLLHGATAARRFRVLMGAGQPLPHPPAPPEIQPGATDDDIARAVAAFLRDAAPGSLNR